MKRFVTTLAATTILKMTESIRPTGRGAFILFEGIDRCGKTTQSGLLGEHCKSTGSAELIRFPDRKSSIGQLIDSYLQSTSNLNDKAIHLLFSANRWESSTGLEAKLASGTTLICDRYAYSGVAFTSAKGLDLEWCKACDQGLPAPDCVIYLDMPVEEAAQRGNFGEERYEKIDFQLKVREKFMHLKDEDLRAGNIPWHVIDARQSIETIQAQIKDIASKTIESVGDKPIARMWTKN